MKYGEIKASRSLQRTGEEPMDDKMSAAMNEVCAAAADVKRYSLLLEMAQTRMRVAEEKVRKDMAGSGLTLEEENLCRGIGVAPGGSSKITAIKKVRERTSLGLREAKDIVDAFCIANGL